MRTLDWNRRDALLTVGTTVSMLLGIALVLLSDPTATVLGIVLIAVSGIIFVVDSKDILVEADETESRNEG